MASALPLSLSLPLSITPSITPLNTLTNLHYCRPCSITVITLSHTPRIQSNQPINHTINQSIIQSDEDLDGFSIASLPAGSTPALGGVGGEGDGDHQLSNDLQEPSWGALSGEGEEVTCLINPPNTLFIAPSIDPLLHSISWDALQYTRQHILWPTRYSPCNILSNHSPCNILSNT